MVNTKAFKRDSEANKNSEMHKKMMFHFMSQKRYKKENSIESSVKSARFQITRFKL